MLPPLFEDWFRRRFWRPYPHQLEMAAAARRGDSTLLVAPTGAGKTLSGFLPSLVEIAAALEAGETLGLHTLYLSPLKALAIDVHRNLEQPIAELGLAIRAETRTGDTPAAKRDRQRRKPPHLLMTTPESLALLLAHRDGAALFKSVRTVVVDELHAAASPACQASPPAAGGSGCRRRLPTKGRLWAGSAAASRGRRPSFAALPGRSRR
jgi:ATP-dependent Lhr-like helicase